MNPDSREVVHVRFLQEGGGRRCGGKEVRRGRRDLEVASVFVLDQDWMDSQSNVENSVIVTDEGGRRRG